MSDHDFRMALTRAMGIGNHYAIPQDQVIYQVRRRHEAYIQLQRIAKTLGFDIPEFNG